MFNPFIPLSNSQERPNRRSDPNSAHLTHGINSNSLHGPSSQESIGSSWDSMNAADDGMISVLQGQAEPGPYDFLRAMDQHQTDSPSSSQVSNTHILDGFASQPQIPTLLSGEHPSSLPPSHHASPQMPHAYPLHISPAQLSMPLDRSNPVSPNAFAAPQTSGNGFSAGFEFNFKANDGSDHRRSGSAASHHTTSNSFSGGSECSYSVTDVSEGEDAEMGQAEGADGLGGLNFGRMGLKGEKTWTQYDQDAMGSGGVSGGGAGGAASSSRKSSGGAPKVEKDKLEHRRSINRKSAQKHRARRKEELEELTIQIAERDARILQLERDLAVERAKNAQMTDLMRGSQGAGFAAGDSSRESANEESDASSSAGNPQIGQGGKKADGRKTRGMKKAETVQVSQKAGAS